MKNQRKKISFFIRLQKDLSTFTILLKNLFLEMYAKLETNIFWGNRQHQTVYMERSTHRPKAWSSNRVRAKKNLKNFFCCCCFVLARFLFTSGYFLHWTYKNKTDTFLALLYSLMIVPHYLNLTLTTGFLFDSKSTIEIVISIPQSNRFIWIIFSGIVLHKVVQKLTI